MIKRWIALGVGLILTAVGLYQWASLWRYSVQTSGNITSFVVVTSNSSIFNIHSAEKSAVVGVSFQAPNGQTQVISFRSSQTDMPLHEGVPLHYDPLDPSVALAETDYQSTLTQGIALIAAGVLIMGIASISWWNSRKEPAKTQKTRHRR